MRALQHKRGSQSNLPRREGLGKIERKLHRLTAQPEPAVYLQTGGGETEIAVGLGFMRLLDLGQGETQPTQNVREKTDRQMPLGGTGKHRNEQPNQHTSGHH